MGVGWGHNRGNFFLNVFIKGTYLKDLLNKNQWAHRAQIYLKISDIVQTQVFWAQ
jgi:hypothetical protein